MPFFRKSIFYTECDECDRRFPITGGGVCERCRRILCGTHLHGSIGRRIAIAFGAKMVCTRCRSGESLDTIQARESTRR